MINDNIKVVFKDYNGFKYVKIINKQVGANFNINKKTAKGALDALGVDYSNLERDSIKSR